MTKRTRAVRTVGKLVVGSVLSVALGLGGAYLAWLCWNGASLLVWIAAALILFGSLVVAISAGMRRAPCPQCGFEMPEIDESKYQACDQCSHYLTGNGAFIWAVESAFIAEHPSFSVRVPERFVWPDGCVVCGEAAERRVPVNLKVSNTGKNVAVSAAHLALGRLAVQTGGERVFSLDVPHCSKHNDGAALELPSFGDLRILFRSYAYQRAFRERNNAPVR